MERVEKLLIIKNPQGLHARPASMFVQLANRYDVIVKVEKEGEVVDGKSIIGLLSLGASKGTKVRLIIEGPEAKEAMDELAAFLEKEE